MEICHHSKFKQGAFLIFKLYANTLVKQNSIRNFIGTLIQNAEIKLKLHGYCITNKSVSYATKILKQPCLTDSSMYF